MAKQKKATKSGVSRALAAAKFERATSYTTRIRGWRNTTRGYVVSETEVYPEQTKVVMDASGMAVAGHKVVTVTHHMGSYNQGNQTAAWHAIEYAHALHNLGYTVFVDLLTSSLRLFII